MPFIEDDIMNCDIAPSLGRLCMIKTEIFSAT